MHTDPYRIRRANRKLSRSLMLRLLSFTTLLTSPVCTFGGFIDDYSFASFQLTNAEADGMAAATGGGLPFVIIGGNTGSGSPGTTDLVAIAWYPATIWFRFSFTS